MNKIKTLAKEQGLSLSYICEKKLGLTKVYFNNITKSNSDIPDERLKIIADTLNTTVAYLRDETDKKEKPLQTQELPEKAKLFIELFEKVPEERQELVIQLLQSLQSSEDKE